MSGLILFGRDDHPDVRRVAVTLLSHLLPFERQHIPSEQLRYERSRSGGLFPHVYGALDLPHVHFEITEQLGHSKVYKDNRICSRIVHFFSSPVS